MCGIVGIVSCESIADDVFNKMIMTLHHRGPDANGKYFSSDNKVALGHTRLSIIDLSQQANQPMISDDGRYVMVFNGEIYNFKALRNNLLVQFPDLAFKTNSDTEVLLQSFIHFGQNMVERIEGMFAAAIYDVEARKLFLFRDRKGKKPIFYYWDNKQFVFASEIKTLLAHPSIGSGQEIDRQAIHDFLHLGFIPEPKTIYRSIRKFPSGSVGEISSALSISINQYWQVEDFIGRKEKNYSIATIDYKKLLLEKLNKAIEKRLVSDVPLGSFLSGGTDSSLVTAVAAQQLNAPLKTFCVGFKESRFDEHKYAALVAKHLKTEHYEFILSELESVELLESYLDHFDEPFADTSAIPTMLVAKMAKEKVTVALTGDGGDELFLGYGSYTWADRLAHPVFKSVKPILTIGLALSNNPRYNRISKLLSNGNGPLLRNHIFSQEQYFFSHEEIDRQLLRNPIDYNAFCYYDSPEVTHLTEAEKQAVFDFKYYLKDDLLVKIDRASMYYSLECRCPLLDNEIIEFALNAPVRLKKNGKMNKWILKELLKDYLPDNLVNRSKWGFSIPLGNWMKNELRYLMDYLSEERLDQTQLFNNGYIQNLMDRFFNGEQYLYNRLWVIIIIQRFLLKNA